MTIYKCDGCGKQLEARSKVYIEHNFDCYRPSNLCKPEPVTQLFTVDLCDDCWKKLRKILGLEEGELK